MPVEHVIAAVDEWKTRHPAYQLYADYTAGRHQLKFTTPDWTTKYAKQMLAGAVLSIRENLCPATISSFTDAITVDSWGDTLDAQTAAEFGLPRHLGYLKRESWRTGDAYSLVWPDASGKPRASFQRAELMVPHVDDLNPDVLDRCAKIWRDDTTKRGRVNIYYPDRLERWETITPIADTGDGWHISDMPTQATGWRGCTDGDGDTIAHQFGAVPVCWYKLDADDPAAHGASILNDVIPLQDGLNSSLANMLVNQEAYSRPFWYLLNFKSQDAVNPYLQATHAGQTLDGAITNGPTPQTGKQGFDRTTQSIVTHDGPGPFGQLDPPDLTRLLAVQEAFKTKVCSVVGIPPYLMSAEIGNVPSGAALRVLSARRVSRIKAWEADNTPVFRGLKQLLGMSDDTPIRWAPPLALDLTEKWEVALHMQQLGYALEDILAWLGEPDIQGIVDRATASSTSSAARMAQAFMDGQGAASYGG